VPLPPLVVKALREWKLACPKGVLGLVFPSGTGEVGSHSNILQRHRCSSRQARPSPHRCEIEPLGSPKIHPSPSHASLAPFAVPCGTAGGGVGFGAGGAAALGRSQHACHDGRSIWLPVPIPGRYRSAGSRRARTHEWVTTEPDGYEPCNFP